MAKKQYTNVRISAKNAKVLKLMLTLHCGQCDEHLGKCFDVMPKNDADLEHREKAIQSWRRLRRKAKSFAIQFHEIALNAEAGDQMNLDPVELR